MTYEQQRAADRHRRILDAALRVFVQRGYRDTAVDDIAAESGTSKGGLYFHFPGKQAIFLALLDQAVARLHRKVEEALASWDDPVARADAALLGVLQTFAAHRGLARLFMIEAPGAGREFQQRMTEVRDEFAAIVTAQLDQAVAAGVIEPVDTAIAGRAWFGALYEVITAWLTSGRPKRLEDAYGALRPLLMRSVGAGDGRRPSRDGRQRTARTADATMEVQAT